MIKWLVTRLGPNLYFYDAPSGEHRHVVHLKSEETARADYPNALPESIHVMEFPTDTDTAKKLETLGMVDLNVDNGDMSVAGLEAHVAKLMSTGNDNSQLKKEDLLAPPRQRENVPDGAGGSGTDAYVQDPNQPFNSVEQTYPDADMTVTGAAHIKEDGTLKSGKVPISEADVHETTTGDHINESHLHGPEGDGPVMERKDPKTYVQQNYVEPQPGLHVDAVEQAANPRSETGGPTSEEKAAQDPVEHKSEGEVTGSKVDGQSEQLNDPVDTTDAKVERAEEEAEMMGDNPPTESPDVKEAPKKGTLKSKKS